MLHQQAENYEKNEADIRYFPNERHMPWMHALAPVHTVMYDGYGIFVTIEASDDPEKTYSIVSRLEVSPDADQGYVDFLTYKGRTFARCGNDWTTTRNFSTYQEAQYFCLGWMLDTLGVKN